MDVSHADSSGDNSTWNWNYNVNHDICIAYAVIVFYGLSHLLNHGCWWWNTYYYILIDPLIHNIKCGEIHSFQYPFAFSFYFCFDFRGNMLWVSWGLSTKEISYYKWLLIMVCSTSDLSILPQLDQLIYFEAETVTDSEIIYHA